MMYWEASEYNSFEKEIIDHLKTDDGWFERYCQRELEECELLYKKGLDLKKIDWSKKDNSELKFFLTDILDKYRSLACAWYAQYPLDEYFEITIEEKLAEYIHSDDPDFRSLVLTFTDPEMATEVSQERMALLSIARDFFEKGENLNELSVEANDIIDRHLDKYAYINRGLATSKPYSFNDIVKRLGEIKKQVDEGEKIKDMIYNASEEKVAAAYKSALERIKPKSDFLEIIRKAKHHSYLRNRRVEAFFNADFGASFLYSEIARRSNFNPDEIMEVTDEEMFGALEGNPLPDEKEMARRHENYAMIVRNSKTQLITDPYEIKRMEKDYFVDVVKSEELKGRVACMGGVIRGRAKICLDKKDISKVNKGDILVAQFTTPDFVVAMEKAAAIIADQGGLSSHAAIVSRELGVPCVMDTKNGTRIIHDNDLVEVDAKTGVIRIVERATN
ncbi:MAG: PEP-utilizing enzyme [Candidatus Moranbacteria bacterium]|nr:PEP-utilizing enzyme [Candidatus Moranbacteria bacterium]